MSNKRLVFIHGFLENASMWKTIVPLLSKSDYHLDFPELPGHGGNHFLPAEKTAETYCENILDQLKLKADDSVLIIAHSMGGYLSSSLAAMIPKQIRALCLFHSKAGADIEQKIADRRRAIQAAQENKNLYVRTMLTGVFYDKNLTSCAEPLKQLIEDAQQLSVETIVGAQQVMIARPDRIETLKSRSFPLYYFLGDHDASLPIAVMQAELALLPGAVANIVQGIGHMGHLEKKREAIDFLQRIIRSDYG